MTTKTNITVKYIVHRYDFYRCKPSTATFRKLDTAISALNTAREQARRWYEDGTWEELRGCALDSDTFTTIFESDYYIEKVVGERMAY